MMPILKILALLVVVGVTTGFPQISPDDTPGSPPALSPSPSPSDLLLSGSPMVSPLAQWLSMVTPPIAALGGGGSKKKKKLLPGPLPPPGMLEAPWVSWTRMKVATAMAPSPGLAPFAEQFPQFPLPPTPPPTPVISSGNMTSPDQSVWIQWTQMKLPMTGGAPPVPSSEPATPWDAWTQSTAQTPQEEVSEPNDAEPSVASTVSKRMAPDRFMIASTMAPKVNWAPAPTQQTQATSLGGSPLFHVMGPSPAPSQFQPISLRQSYMEWLNMTAPNISARVPPYTSSSSSASSPSGSVGRPISASNVGTLPIYQPGRLLAPAILAQAMPSSQFTPSQASRPSSPHPVNPSVTRVQTSSSSTTNPSSTALISALKPIPHQIVSTLLSQGTASEIADVVTAVSQIEDGETPQTKLVGELLPATFILKLSDELTPLLNTPITVPADKTEPLSLIPESVRSEILDKATPSELSALLTTLEKLQELPPSQQASIAGIEVSTILPPSLEAKLPPETESSPPAKLIPPVVSAALPEPLVNAIVSVATLQEVSDLIQTIATVPPSVTPSIGVIIPPSLLSKLPPQVAPLLMKPLQKIPPVPITPSVPNAEIPPTVTPGVAVEPANNSALLAEVIPAHILQLATPKELAEITTKLEALQEPTVYAEKPILDLLPVTLIAKLPSQIFPLLKEDVVLPPKSISLTVDIPDATITPVPGVPPIVVQLIETALAPTLPKPVISQILIVASPEEVAELSETIAKLEELPPDQKPLIEKLVVQTIIPPTLVAKLPPQIIPLLSKPLVVAPVTILPSPPASIPGAIPPAPIPGTIPPAPIPGAIPPAPIPGTIPPAPIPGAILPTPGVPPIVQLIETALAPTLPKPVISQILIAASPEEVAELSETIAKLEELPPDQKPLIEKLIVQTIIPPTLVAKLPPQIIPILSKPLVVAPVTILPSPPASVPGAIPPPPVATPSVFPPVASPVPGAIPPAAALPVPTTKIKPLVPGVPPAMVQGIVTALAPTLPKPVIKQILVVATPVEVTELAETLNKLESVPLAEKPALEKLEVETILPPTLVPRLPPPLIPVLSTTLVLPLAPIIIPPVPVVVPGVVPPAAVPLVPETITPPLIPGIVPTAPGVPAPASLVPGEVPPIVVAALSPVLPQPVIITLLSTATPEELEELAETLDKLETLQPEEKPLISNLEVETIIPPSLVARLPPDMIPSLSIPLVLPPTPIPSVAPLPSTTLPASNPPVLAVIPEPVLSQILAIATPIEIKELEDSLIQLEALSPEVKGLIPPTLPLFAILPPTLPPKLPLTLMPFLSQEVTIPSAPEATEAPAAVPVLPPVEEEPVTPAEEKLLTKWAKIILLKTGKPTPPVPGEIPPLQAAWTEWVQLKANKTAKAPLVPGESTTEYPWTQWLKLKSNITTIPPAPTPIVPPPLDVTTASPEKAVLDWLENMAEGTPLPAEVPAPVTPITEGKIAEILKELGVENVDLPPETVSALLASLGVPPPTSLTSAAPEISEAVASPMIPPTTPILPPAFIPGMPPFPIMRPIPFYPYMVPVKPMPMSPFMTPFTPYPTETIPAVPGASITPTLNLTAYLVAHKIIPAEFPPTSSISIPALAKLLENSSVETTSSEEETSDAEGAITEKSITPEDLSALTASKLASLIKQILKECKRNITSLATRSATYSPGTSIGAYYKKKYGGPWATYRVKRALYPIPSQGVSVTPPPLEPSPQPEPVENILPLPTVDTTGTVLDPAFWAAQKSLFLSKLFATLAKVVMNETTATSLGEHQAVTQSPKDLLAKQVNTVLLSDMTRSIKQHEPEEEDDYEEEDETEDESTGNGSDFNENEKELVNNDNSEPNLPKEPENPLHKLFKFGVQKTVLSDINTPAPPIYIYVTPEPPPETTPDLPRQKEMVNRLKQVYRTNKSKAKSRKKPTKGPKKGLKKKQPKKFQKSHHHHSNANDNSSNNANRFRPTRPPPATTAKPMPTTTESPVDFELLAKALLMDKTGAKK